MGRHSGFHQTDASLAMSALASLAKSANASIAIKSNTSPDIVINIGDMLAPGADPTGAQSVSSSNQSALNWIKPQIVIQAGGATNTYAPYGTPNSLGFVGFAIAALLMALLGGKLALMLCRKLGKH